jgi:hypothetical protein
VHNGPAGATLAGPSRLVNFRSPRALLARACRPGGSSLRCCRGERRRKSAGASSQEASDMRRFEWAAMIGLSMASLLVTAVPTPADGGTAQGSGSTTSGGSFTQSQSGSTSGRTESEKESGNKGTGMGGESTGARTGEVCGAGTAAGASASATGENEAKIVGAIVGSLVPVVFSK